MHRAVGSKIPLHTSAIQICGVKANCTQPIGPSNWTQPVGPAGIDVQFIRCAADSLGVLHLRDLFACWMFRLLACCVAVAVTGPFHTVQQQRL